MIRRIIEKGDMDWANYVVVAVLSDVASGDSLMKGAVGDESVLTVSYTPLLRLCTAL